MEIVKTLISIGPRSSLLRTGLFTGGHFFIDLVVISLVTGAPIEIAGIAALIAPAINAAWFYTLDMFWSSLHQKDESQHERPNY